MDEAADIYRTLAEIFATAFYRDDLILSPELGPDDLPGWDSFKQVEILVAIQMKYGIKFSTRDLDGLVTVGDFARVIGAKVGGI